MRASLIIWIVLKSTTPSHWLLTSNQVKLPLTTVYYILYYT